ncbi:MAG: hypothetical protein H6734_12580 [Alphaproteobacteria bacterium]|nr:hypothetical protein [Alphaproteobacteria bacterium]
MLLWTVLLGCQEPFGLDRHDLRGFRIAALTAHVEGGRVFPRVAMVVDGNLYADSPVDLQWGWVEREGDAVTLETFEATGPAPVLPIRAARLALVARYGDQEARAELAIDDQVAVSPRLEMLALPENVQDIGPADLELENRSSWAGDGQPSVDPGGFARFRVLGAPDGARARFMGTAGEFWELDAFTTDWAAGSLTIDDEEVVERVVLEPGPFTILALLLDAGSGVAALDGFVGTPEAGSWTRGRFLQGGLTAPYWGTLVADDGATSGIAVRDVQYASPTDQALWTPDGLDCVGVSGPFDPNWLLDQRCTRDVLAGERVLVVPDP